MIKRIIGYLMAVVITVYWFLMYDGNTASWLLAFEIIYPMCAILSIYVSSRKIQVRILPMSTMVEQGVSIRVRVDVTDSMRLHNTKYRVRIVAKNDFSNVRKRTWISGIAGKTRRNQNTACVYEFETKECASINITVDRLRVYDFLGLFYHTKKISHTANVTVWPKITTFPLEITQRTREFITDADEYSVESAGDDPAEIYQIREYSEQDPIQKIHWKLSAKEDALMVKDNGFPLGCVLLLWIDFSKAGSNAKAYSGIVETAAAIAMTLVEEKCIHMAAWFEESDLRVVKMKIDGEEAVYVMIQRLLIQKPCMNRELVKMYYEDAFRNGEFSSIVQIVGSEEVLVNGEKQEILQL